jgi:diadenosine tetraphosphate (Ap4A) HIT family hydrolase
LYNINVGALGNVVRQFHMHVVARFENDPLWPKGIWGSDLYQDHTSTEKEIIIGRLDEMLG